MCTCIKYIKCNVLGSLCHFPYVTYHPLEMKIYNPDTCIAQQQFQTQYNRLLLQNK
jgi:hypothetical protein